MPEPWWEARSVQLKCLDTKISSHPRGWRERRYQMDWAESLTHCRHSIKVSFFFLFPDFSHSHYGDIYEQGIHMNPGRVLLLLSFVKKFFLKSPFNQSCCQKCRAKIVKVQRRAVKIICGTHGRRACHEKRDSKPWHHFIWKGKLPEAQCLQYNKLTTGIGKTNQDLVFTFPTKYKNQTV